MRFKTFFAAFMLVCAPMLVQAEVISSAENVEVDATGDNATDARNTAIAQGEKIAFRQLVEKMVPDRAIAIQAATPPERISAMIRGYEVLSEKMSSNRYRATLRYNFDTRALARIVGGATTVKAAPVSSGAEPLNESVMLVMPVWKDGATFHLFDNDNIWRLIWNGVVMQRGQGMLVSPFADKRDMDDIDGLRLLGADFALLQPLAERYGTGQIGVMLASVDANDPKQVLQVTLTILTPKGNLAPQEFRYNLKPNETLNMQMQRAATDIAAQLRKARGGDPEVLEEQINTLDVRMQGVTMKQWELIRAKLMNVPAVQKLDLMKMSYFDTTLRITYRGTPDLLGKMLAAAGFRLFKDENALVLALPQ